MKILFLSPHKHLTDFLESNGDEVTQTVEPLTEKMLNVDFIISYGYRHTVGVTGMRLIKCREQLGLLPIDVSSKIRINSDELNLYELNLKRPQPEAMKVLAKFYGTSVEWLRGKDFWERFKRRAINLHISYLPWNRGADPNLWSFLENTPKGVTIHCLDANIDTGDIIFQELLSYNLNTDTLKTTYRLLMEQMEDLFREKWSAIREGKIEPMPQLTFHRVKDKEQFAPLLKLGWDTPVKDLVGKAKER